MKIRKSKMIFFKDSKIVLVEKKDIFFEPAHFCASLQIYFKKKLKSMDFHYAKKISGLILETGNFCSLPVASCACSTSFNFAAMRQFFALQKNVKTRFFYTKPWATMALATLTNPAMFAPAT